MTSKSTHTQEALLIEHLLEIEKEAKHISNLTIDFHVKKMKRLLNISKPATTRKENIATAHTENCLQNIGKF